ncbi:MULTISPECIES: hypothetical protein [unclassified Gilliamella]|uniref:hypothetical protein n=1 Tax=unclassified Gilliamella TaxID=2685620 RepID=UPI00080EC5CF|nr:MULTISPECIES: hypothetical protein [Gilliamella]MCX8574480.1 hypothetical protein [Gilliamella sp. B3831]MCX8576711.1 hypothetical protein [Gilliamella sp. B3815]MCX8578483.1 hypothetical protein [Gilliamella sp. B2717]MCX8587356.1 hypothetical protein [Gilliamella sp. B3801]MCX8589307.1 hypothetical protein [Gilliamella sp. B3812]
MFTDSNTKQISFCFHTQKKKFIKWKKLAKKANMTLSDWIVKKLNSDIDIVLRDIVLPNDIEKDDRWLIKLTIPSVIKGYWVYCSRERKMKLVKWITNKLDS